MESYSRIRSVKLKRSSPEEPFGFSVRGGHEHGTGIFVSHVEPRSVAHKSRLKVGDQILRLNGFPVSAAVHNECLALMRFRTSLNLKVRSVGMIPVKEKIGDPLTWKLVEEPPLPPVNDEVVNSSSSSNNKTRNGGSRYHHHGSHSSSQASHSRQSGSDSSPHFDSRHTTMDPHLPESKVFIDITGHSGLGCCICKGPPERPGIFVQSTKSNGVAREAGLRPGDQVIQCNGHSFLNIPFAEAVYHLKVSKHLNLIVIKGAASDLFPGESSGYNSSASSLNGDMHISASSISSASNTPVEINVVEDEPTHRQSRLPQVSEERRPSSKGSSNSDVDGIALDRHIEWNEVEETWKDAEKERLVIRIRGEEESNTKTTSLVSSVRLSDTVEEKRLLEERKKLLEDQRRLLEEAVKFEEEKRQFEAEKRRLELMKESMIPAAPPVDKFNAENNVSDNVVTANSLVGALHKEILKRVERRENGVPNEKGEDEKPRPGTVDQKISLFASSPDAEKRQQHEQLIKEFKRAHRKMFAHSLEQIETTPDELSDKDPRKTYGAKRIQKEVEHERRLVQQQVAGIVRQRQLRIERQQQECQETDREVGQVKSTFRGTKSPPPPPPVNGVEVKTTSGHTKWTTLSIKLPSGPISSSSDTSSKSKSSDVSKATAATAVITTTTSSFKGNSNNNNNKKPTISSTTTTSTAMSTMKVEEECPESPSPDYSNSPSPIPSPTGENRWDDRVSANGKIYTRDGPTKFGFPPAASRENKDVHPNGLVARFQPNNGAAQKNGYTSNNHKSTTSVIKTKDGEITTSGNGKVTIILGDPNNFSSSHSHGHPISTKSTGGILKMSNGNLNGDHSMGNLPQKTISFGEF